MKFVKLILFTYLIVNYSNCQSDPLIELNNYINKGFSFLNSQSNIIENPSSALSKYNIFNFQIDFSKATEFKNLDFLEFKQLNVSKSSQVKLQDYTREEIMNFNKFQMKGQKPLISNFLVTRTRLLGKKQKLNTIVYYHYQTAFSLALNPKVGFPNFNQVFIKDAIDVFYETANKKEVGDVTKEHKFIKKGIKFFAKYGTHYLSKLYFGSKFSLVTDLVESALHKQGSNQPKTLNLNKTQSDELDKSINNINKYIFSNDRIAKLGKCEYNEKLKSITKCDHKAHNLNLISYDTLPIFELFNKQIYTNNVKLDGNEISVTTMNIVLSNAKFLFTALENSLDINLPLVEQVHIYNNVKKDYENKLSCLKAHNKPSFAIYNTNPRSIMSSENVVDLKIPLFNMDPVNNIMKTDLALIEDNSGLKTYGCVVKKFAANVEDLINGNLFKRKFAIQAIISKDNSYLNNKSWQCQQFWVTVKTSPDGKIEKVINYFCMFMTTNFLIKDLIIDIKFKKFKDACENFTFNDRKYECDCNNDISSIVENSKKKGVYLCVARRG